MYKKYPFLYRAVEYIEDEEAKAQEEEAKEGRDKSPDKKDQKDKKKRKKKRKTFNFGFESTKEIELDELLRIFKETPFQFNYYVTKEIFDSFLADEKNPEFVDLKKLKELLEETELAEFNEEEDMKILLEALDKDKDGKLSYKDLLYNIPYNSYSPADMGEIKRYMHMDQNASHKSPKKTKEKIRKREATCCVVNKDMLKH